MNPQTAPTRTGRSKAALLPRDDEFIRLRRDGNTLEQIADAHGVSRQRVSQVLRNRLGAEGSRAVLRDIRETSRLQRELDEEQSRAEARAARRAGLRARPSRSRWSDADLLTILANAFTMAFPLTGPAYERLRKSQFFVGPTSQAISKRFGSWSKACAAAGVECAIRAPTNRRQWSDAEIVESIRQFFIANNGESLVAYGSWAQTHAAPSSGTVVARFGTWSKAKRRAAGHHMDPA